MLGVLYRDGGLLMPDAVKAKEWFTRSAQQGYVPAQYALGKLLLSDDPEVHDWNAGIRWLQTAEKNGSPYAAYELGKAYLKSGDKQQAESYFTQAAKAENPNAMYMLGKLLYDSDPKRANYWLHTSASYGNPYAQRALDQHTSPTIAACVIRLLYHLSRVIRDNTEQNSHGHGFAIDRKRRRESASPWATSRMTTRICGCRGSICEVTPLQNLRWKYTIIRISNKYKAFRKEVRLWKNNSKPTMTYH